MADHLKSRRHGTTLHAPLEATIGLFLLQAVLEDISAPVFIQRQLS
jgi:hypothetical protein